MSFEWLVALGTAVAAVIAALIKLKTGKGVGDGSRLRKVALRRQAELERLEAERQAKDGAGDAGRRLAARLRGGDQPK